MKKSALILFLLVTCVSPIKSFCQAPKSDIVLGAYYFDGWTGRTNHITSQLKTFTDRQPIGGWITSTPDGISKQIDQAADAGIGFFDFDWYYNSDPSKDFGSDAKNNALKLYLKAPNKQRLKFSIMVTNNGKYSLKAEDWDNLIAFWLKLFKEDTYLKVNDQPFITFYSLKDLITTFGSVANVKVALNKFRAQAKANGFNGISIAAVVTPSQEYANLATQSGFDIVTGYNYHGLGLNTVRSMVVPIKQMNTSENAIWKDNANLCRLPVIPAVTLNFDKRPMDIQGKLSKRFDGYSDQSVKNAIINARKWIKNNPTSVTKEKLVVLYAWNEYGEGSWLTPSVGMGSTLLQGLKSGLTENLN